MFARFNEINSTDDFDIHCRREKYGRLVGRSCQSNSWHEESGKIGSEQAAAIQGRASPGLGLLIATQRGRKERLLNAEMQQLAAEDDQLQQAFADLSKARLALMRRSGNITMVREVSAISGNLSYDAERAFEIIMGNDPYRLRLTQQTFTVANVLGEIRKIGVECAEGSRRFDYAADVDWTLPSGWSACVLQVDAKKGTTFMLYEF